MPSFRTVIVMGGFILVAYWVYNSYVRKYA